MESSIKSNIDFHPWDSEEQVKFFLESLLNMHCCESFLEIGTFRGMTTFPLISKLKEKFTAIDLEDYRLDFVKDLYKENNSWFIQNDSLTVLQAFIKEKRKYDAIFIDSFHSYEQVSKEFYLCYQIINKGGLIIFHDSILHEGVSKFINELRQNQFNLNIEIITFKTPEIEGRGGASGLSIAKII